MKGSMKKAVLGTVLSASLLMAAMGPAGACEQNGKWMSGDFHQHTFYTDGSTTFDFAMEKNNFYGLDWWANSEHGGGINRDGEGHLWTDTAYYPTNPILGEKSGTPQVMWRWQSLRDYAFLDILNTRELYPKKRVFSGLEWNVPGHEHCSTAIVADDASAISAFEFQFDKSDKDLSRIGESTPYGTLVKTNKTHADTVAAVTWMQNQYKDGTIDNGWIIFAHIERAGVWNPATGSGGYNVESFRDFNNAAPDVCFGFEGAPGHQVNDYRGLGNTVTCVGDLCTSKDFGGTYGGVGYYTAKVGGLWDSLLGEGRHWFNFANSDYHARYDNGGDDFYPGEYQKTWVYVKDTERNGKKFWSYLKDKHDDKYTLSEIADGLRSGNVFFAHGDLINYLEFEATGNNREASMGGELKAHGNIKNLNLTIKFKSPKTNNCVADMTYITSCAAPVVDHIDLIAGDITGKIDPNSSDYTKNTNDIHQGHCHLYLKRLEKRQRRLQRHQLPNQKIGQEHVFPPPRHQSCSEYALMRPMQTAIRWRMPWLRSKLEIPAAERAWKDLWFYSNPIFVYAN